MTELMPAVQPNPLRVPRRVRVSGDLYHGRVPAGAIYVGRAAPGLPASPYANPHRAGSCRICAREHDQADTVDAYAHEIAERPALLAAARRELAGTDLACWCAASPCHGDLLLQVAAGTDPVTAAAELLAPAALVVPDNDLRSGADLSPTTAAVALTLVTDLTNRAGYTAVTEAWLANRRLSEHTRAAYRRDVDDFLDWCTLADIDPATATFTHTNGYARHLEKLAHPRKPGERRYTDSSIARKLSAVASWYKFLVKLRAVTNNPLDDTDRPAVDRDHSSTRGLTVEQVDQLLAAIDKPRPGSDTRTRDRAVVTLLADLGLRVGEVCGLDVNDLGHDRDHRTLSFVGKGGKRRRRSLDPGTARAIDAYLTERAAAAGTSVDQLDGALFVTDTARRLDRHAVAALIRSLAKRAGLPRPDTVTPHSLRHSFATAAREAGVSLEDVQDAMAHADPRTTRRYDRDRHSLDRDPSHQVWSLRMRRRQAPMSPPAADAKD